jgi:hypothetical protein
MAWGAVCLLLLGFSHPARADELVIGLRMVAESTYRRGATFAQSMRRQVELLRKGEPDAIIFGPGKHQALDAVYYTVVDKGRFVLLDDWKRWRK